MNPDDPRLMAALTVLADQPVSTLGALGFVVAFVAAVLVLDWLAVLLMRAEERRTLREEAERRAARPPSLRDG